MPNVLTMVEAAALLRMTPKTLIRRIRKEVGEQAIFRGSYNRLMTTAAVVARLMNMTNRCPTCDRPWHWFPEPDDEMEWRKEALGL